MSPAHGLIHPQTAGGLLSVVLIAFSLRGNRIAYALFVVLGLAYFPMKAGFDLEPRACQFALDAEQAAMSVTNFGHIVLFALFFFMTYAQLSAPLRAKASGLVLAAVIALTMGALVEGAQGITGYGNCRLRDLIPDAIGIALAAGATTAWAALRRGSRTRN